MPATNTFPNQIAAITGPFVSGFAITPSDGTDLATTTRYLYVGGAGAVKVDLADGSSTVTLAAVPVGTLLPIRANRVYSTGTTATNLVGLY